MILSLLLRSLLVSHFPLHFFEHLEQSAPPSLQNHDWHGHSTHGSSNTARTGPWLLTSVIFFSRKHMPEKEPPANLSVSDREVCWERSIHLSGADPVNPSTLHHFRCVLAVHLPYSEHPRGALHLCYIAHVSAVLGPCRAVSQWSHFSVASQYFTLSFSHHIEEALAMSCVWHVLMLRELPLSENVTISLIPHLHF